jgi:hypothetical protein
MNSNAFAASTRNVVDQFGLELLLKDAAPTCDRVNVLFLGMDRVDRALKEPIPILGCSRDELIRREFLSAWALHAHDDVIQGLKGAESELPEWFRAFDEAVYATASPLASDAVFGSAHQAWRDPGLWRISEDLLSRPRKARPFAAAALGILADALYQQEEGWRRMLADFRPSSQRSSPVIPVRFKAARLFQDRRNEAGARPNKKPGAHVDQDRAAER